MPCHTSGRLGHEYICISPLWESSSCEQCEPIVLAREAINPSTEHHSWLEKAQSSATSQATHREESICLWFHFVEHHAQFFNLFDTYYLQSIAASPRSRPSSSSQWNKTVETISQCDRSTYPRYTASHLVTHKAHLRFYLGRLYFSRFTSKQQGDRQRT